MGAVRFGGAGSGDAGREEEGVGEAAAGLDEELSFTVSRVSACRDGAGLLFGVLGEELVAGESTAEPFVQAVAPVLMPTTSSAATARDIALLASMLARSSSK
ncbi:hypothetical protein [Streptomyces achromogenes]|uniref:hypothetical protein n=1 Tax=Streptomyces achromogenes TaxID=67255 RepID=UPI0036F5377A